MKKRMKKIRVAVIYGGISGEHEVSLVSARSVMAALNRAKYDVLPIKIGKDGRWTVERAGLRDGERTLSPAARDERLLNTRGRGAEKIDVAFPLVHGTGGEDGSLQGLFELAGIPYVGSGVLGSAIGMDKIMQKKVFEQEGLPTAAYVSFTAGEWTADRREILERIERHLAYPCFVKPANMGSSVGISKAHHRKELLRGITDALRYDRRVAVEAAVPDAREIECAVLGNDHPHASVLGEIVPSNEFYDYAAKYLDGASQTIIPADLPKPLTERIRGLALRAFKVLDAAGLARVDFFVQRSSGDVFINEINTLPGFTDISMYPKMWAASGLPYSELLDELIRLAIERGAERRGLVRSFKPPTSRSVLKLKVKKPVRTGRRVSKKKR
jgi:D-alanine-D-alanine ligase